MGSLDPFGECGVTGIHWEGMGIIGSGGRMGSLDPVEKRGVWDLVKEREDHWIQWKSSMITGIQWKSMRVRLSCAATHTHRDCPETWALYQLPS